jgi:hypothetical protein
MARFRAFGKVAHWAPSQCAEGFGEQNSVFSNYSSVRLLALPRWAQRLPFCVRISASMGLRLCATIRKVQGSIPDGVTGIFHWLNPSGRTMALGSTQPLTEISTRGIWWGEWRPVRGADNLSIFICRLSWHLRASASWSPNGVSRPVMVYLYLLIESGSYSYTTSGLPEVLAAMAGLLECVQKSCTSSVTMLGFIQSIFLSPDRILQHGRYNRSVQ